MKIKMNALIKRSNSKINIFFLIGFGGVVSIILRFLVLNAFPFSLTNWSNIYILSIFETGFQFPSFFFYLVSGINLLLIYRLISQYIGRRIYAYMAIVVYLLSPWFIYLERFGSFFLVELVFVLLLLNGIGSKSLREKVFFTSAGYGLLILSHLVFIVLLPILLIYFYGHSKKIITSLVIITLFTLGLGFWNTIAFVETIKQDISIFEDPGLINSVNTFQGNLRDAGFSFFDKIVINKYEYYFIHLVRVILIHISPVSYFTAQYSMYGFSNLAPISVGFLIPCMVGLWAFFVSTDMRKKMILFLLGIGLMIPSIVSKKVPDMERLVLFSPIIILLIIVGFNYLWMQKKLLGRVLIIISLSLLLFQNVVFMGDVASKEHFRYQEFLGRDIK